MIKDKTVPACVIFSSRWQWRDTQDVLFTNLLPFSHQLTFILADANFLFPRMANDPPFSAYDWLELVTFLRFVG